MSDATDALDPPARPSRGVWRALREAVAGSNEEDYTSGPIGRAILLLAVPMVLEMAMESVFALTDIFFVSRLGETAVAAVGLTESLLTIVYALAMGLSIGATALVARRVGEKDADGAARSSVQAVIVAITVSAVLGVSGVVLAHRLLGLMGATPAIVAEGLGYTRVMLGGEATIIILFVVNAILRGAGDAATAMRVLWLANAINILLGPCLIFGLGPFPRLGVTGAAIATTIGRGTGALFAISRLLRRDGRIHIRRAHLGVDLDVIRQIGRLSLTASAQSLIGTASWIGLVRILSTFGSAALAGYTIGIRIIIFALLPAFGLGNAAATLVGQALGAGKPERAEQAVWKAGFYNMIFLGGAGVLLVLLARPIVALFSPDAAAGELAVSCLRIVASGFPFYAYGQVVTQALNGAGDTTTPTLLNLFVFWLWEIPIAWVLSETLGMGPSGVFVSITVAFTTLAAASVVVFRRGRWKARVV